MQPDLADLSNLFVIGWSLVQKRMKMKKFLITSIALLCGWLAIAQQSDVRSVGSFSGVKAGEAIDVYLKKGDKESVRVEVTGTDAANVLTEVSGGYLRIHMRDGRYKNKNVKVYVTYVAISKIHASSAANIFSEGTVKSTNLDISTSSAASVEISIDAGAVTAEASSAGDLLLEGKAKSLEVDVSSAGEVDAYLVESEIVRASASSAGSAKISVSKELTARASSGGSIRYRGSPTKTNTDSSSGGSVKKAN
jgi:Putative auto-transporter adhesin, head GIN domain